jgi:hypothetical protein
LLDNHYSDHLFLFQHICYVGTKQGKESFILQNAQFLSYANKTKTDDNNYESLEGIVEVVVTEADLIKLWFDYLKEVGQAPDSIRGRLNNISILLQQFATSIFRTGIPSVLLVIKSLVRVCVFEMKQKHSSSEDMIDQGLLPKKGKGDLIAMWDILCPLLDDIMALARRQVISTPLYILAIQILFFGFYSENANGRMQAIVFMTMADYRQLCAKSYYTSKKTKSLTYGEKQIVCLGNNSDLLVRIQDYMSILRPQAIHRCGNESEHVFLQ